MSNGAPPGLAGPSGSVLPGVTGPVGTEGKKVVAADTAWHTFTQALARSLPGNLHFAQNVYRSYRGIVR